MNLVRRKKIAEEDWLEAYMAHGKGVRSGPAKGNSTVGKGYQHIMWVGLYVEEQKNKLLTLIP